MDVITSWSQIGSLLTGLAPLLDELRNKHIMVSIVHCGIRDAEGGYGRHCLFRIRATAIIEQCMKCGYAPKVHGIREEAYLEDKSINPNFHRHSWGGNEVTFDAVVASDSAFKKAISYIYNKVISYQPSISNCIPQEVQNLDALKVY